MPDQSTPKRLSRRPRVTCICEVCDASFLAPPRKVEAGLARFCSVTCRAIARRTRIEQICEHCGKVFLTHPNRLLHGRGRFCSRSCGTASKQGADASHWKGGRTMTPTGYVKVRVAKGKDVFEHRLVMEQVIGRPLLPEEVVHHCDGNPANNDPGNLLLFANNVEHMRFHKAQAGDQWGAHARKKE